MKQFFKVVLLIFAVFLLQYSMANKITKASIFTNKTVSVIEQIDTNYRNGFIVKSKKTYLYSQPNSKYRTKAKFPQNSILAATKKSGDFVFCEYNTSTNCTNTAWFLLSDLKEMRFTPPKIVYSNE